MKFVQIATLTQKPVLHQTEKRDNPMRYLRGYTLSTTDQYHQFTIYQTFSPL